MSPTKLVHPQGGAIPHVTSVSVRTGSQSPGYLPEARIADTQRGRFDRFSAYFVPLAIAASLFTPSDPFVFERIRVSPRTPIRQLGWRSLWENEEPWVFVPELITNDQVRLLDELFALTPPPELRSFLADTG